MSNSAAVSYTAKISLFPKKDMQLFGYALVEPEGDYNRNDVVPICVFHGIGERGNGSEAALKKMVGWDGWYNGKEPTLFASVNKWPVVFILVQTDKDFEKGEIPFAFHVARNLFPGWYPSAIGLSLGGFALITYYAKVVDVVLFESITVVMPGGNVESGKLAGVRLGSIGMSVLAFHAMNDEVANWKTSQALVEAANDSMVGRGEAFFALYEKGGHSISSRPFASWFPWTSWNMTDKKIVEGYYKPGMAMIQWIIEKTRRVIVPPVVPELMVDAHLKIWRIEDGYRVEATGMNQGLADMIRGFVESLQ